jgi:chromosome segregation ATPase
VNSIEKIKEIQSGLTLTLNNLRQQIRRFESERPNVLCEIEGLKKDVESRASDLEVEVDQLRENLKSLKDLLGFSEESP